MNPLTAIRQFLAPEIQPAPLPGRGAKDLEPSPIPSADLETLPVPLQPAQSTQVGETGPAFTKVLGQLIEDVNAKQVAAGDAVRGVLTGQNVSLHQAVIAMEEASVSFQLMVEVRNKLLESYQELMRMQV